MAFLATKNNTSFKKTLQFDVRRRKRHFNKMNIIKLIFLGCCLTLILNPLFAQAKEATNNKNNNATSKGENMRLTTSDEDLKLGKKDKTNDNVGDGEGTFKRLKPLDYKDLQQQLEADVEKVEEEEQEQEEEYDGETEDHSSEVIEMIQPAHTLRHQEHYKQRILMAAAEKQKLQLENSDNEKTDIDNNNNNDHGNNDDDDDDDYDMEEQEREHELLQHNRNLRYQQIQLALREPIATSTKTPPLLQQHHHHRHAHHLAKQKMAKQTEFLWPQQHQQQQQQQQQHHLRHQHHQHHKPTQLHHNHHILYGNTQMRKQNLTTNSKPLTHHQRYFDRESSNTNPWSRIVTTEGPHLRHSGFNRNWKSINFKTNPHNRLFNDEEVSLNDNNENNKEIENDNDNDNDNDLKRISLSLEGPENNNENKENSQNANNNNSDYDPNNDHEETNEKDKEDDYSYEDDDDDDKEINKSLKYPSIISQAKANVKRYTKPLNKPFTSSSYAYRSNQHNSHLRHIPTIKSNLNHDNNDNDDDYDEDNENSSDDSSSSASNSDDDDKFSDEKWNKIEHEHYRKQLQHQRAMQALRSRRPTTTTTTNDNNKTPTININRYASYTPPTSSSYNTAAWTKRQTVNEDDGENIYSRYYVPGTVTRKKEEELGSPTAILESRRQYALQQRQNKALASAHHRRIVTEGSCRLPQPRVERIRRDSWKIYTPHCTILHRCADDAGCCPSERQTCAPKRTKNVDLYFFVISLNETQGSIEKLTFVNHTECHCVERSKQRAPEYGSSAAKDLINNNQIPYLRRNNILNCHCPNLFEKILQEDGYCRCDCSSGNMGCDWLKRGMEHFSMNDRKCIMEGRCKLPTCEYGQYIKKHGRCPRREERHLSADIDW